MRLPRPLVLAAAALLGVCAAPAAARAHDLKVKIDVSADPARAEAYFDDETPADFATMRVTDADGTEVASGKADARGVWTFARPAPGAYALTARAFGHVETVPFIVGGGPSVFTGWRLNRTLGLTAGVVGLLGTSAVYWYRRRRRG